MTDLYIETHKHRHNTSGSQFVRNKSGRPHFRRLINKSWEFEQIMGNSSLLEKHKEIQTVLSKVQSFSVKFGSSDVNGLTQPKSDHLFDFSLDRLIWSKLQHSVRTIPRVRCN